MASTTALLTGLTGLNANARNIDVIGNNIANVNTPAFKSSRLNFSTMFSRTYSYGSGPGADTGGTNPFQVGYGVNTAGTQRNFTNGTLSPTGDARDLAIDGNGFFQIRRGDRQLFTRAGNFRPDSEQYLSTPGGDRLQGYAVDANYSIIPGRLGDIRIPLGSLTLAEATRNVRLRGNLNASGSVPTQGARVDLTGTATAGLRAITTASPAPGTGNLLEATTRLVDIEDPQLPTTDTPLFAAGQHVELKNAERGGRTIPAQRLDITSTTTVQDLMDFFTMALGITTTTGANPDGRTPGVSLDPATGTLTIVGNTGTVNDLVIDPTDLRLLDSGGTLLRNPFAAAKQAASDGESVRTSFLVYDSLGTPVDVTLSMVMESKSNAGTTWRYMAESPGTTSEPVPVGTGVLNFNTAGRLDTTTPVSITIDRTGTGAETPLAVNLSFASTEDSVTALTDERSELAATFRDGAPIGTLSGFGVGLDGVITGSFTNGLTRTIGQVAVATFVNNEGLVDEGNNLFSVGVNSGPAIVTPPKTQGAGAIVAGAIELSNVDLGEEFIKMILSSTGYSASSRVIRTADELLQQLLVIGR